MGVHFFLALCDTDCLVSPDIIEFLTFVISTDVVVFIRIFQDFLLRIRQNEFHAIREILDTVSPTQFKFKTVGLHIRIIDLWHSCT